MLQAGRRGGRLGKWMGACWFWRAPKIMGARPHKMGARPHSERAPKNNGCAPSFCGRFGDFLLFFIAAKSWCFLDPLAVIQIQSVDFSSSDFCIRRLDRFVLFQFFYWPIFFFLGGGGLKFRFLYRAIVSVCFKFRFYNWPILFLVINFVFRIDQL
jgi:hypothetical protein